MKRQQDTGFLRTFSTLLKYVLSNNKKTFTIIFLLSIVLAVGDIISSIFVRDLVDVYIVKVSQNGGSDYSPVVSYLIKIGAVMLFAVVAAYVSMQLLARVTEKILYNLRKESFDHMQELPVSFFDTHSYGEIMGIFTNDMDTLTDVILTSIPDFFRLGLSAIIVFITMLTTSLRLTLFVVGYLVIVLFVIRFLSRKSDYYFRGNQESIAALNGYAEESINAEKVIKTFSYEERNKEAFKALNDKWAKNSEKAYKYTNIFMPIMANISNMLFVVLASIGVYFSFTNRTSLTVGTIIMFLQLSRSFTGAFNNLSSHVTAIVRACTGAERIFKFKGEKSEENRGVVKLENPKGNIRFEHVTFSYDGKREILHDLSLWADEGQKIAFVGSTGAGKTTITNLLNRFYDIQSGKITFDGIDINTIEKNSLRKSMALVLQDTYLFSGTIRENIRYGNLDASDADVEKAAKLVGADSFIMRLKDGYDTYIKGNDTELSMGQKQLLSIARAAVMNPPVMVLDEATSSVDSESEILIQKGMDALMKGRTTLMIAHRLSTVRNADAIMVMESGRIIERGNHDDLLKEHGRYYELYMGLKELD